MGFLGHRDKSQCNSKLRILIVSEDNFKTESRKDVGAGIGKKGWGPSWRNEEDASLRAGLPEVR